uniref:Glycosyl transferase family 51 domain-containing protein n=1 Tax=Dictyoglomus turgidum TaxID=513050 RepID=A0A7C3SNJ1_9BACT
MKRAGWFCLFSCIFAIGLLIGADFGMGRIRARIERISPIKIKILGIDYLNSIRRGKLLVDVTVDEIKIDLDKKKGMDHPFPSHYRAIVNFNIGTIKVKIHGKWISFRNIEGVADLEQKTITARYRDSWINFQDGRINLYNFCPEDSISFDSQKYKVSGYLVDLCLTGSVHVKNRTFSGTISTSIIIEGKDIASEPITSRLSGDAVISIYSGFEIHSSLNIGALPVSVGLRIGSDVSKASIVMMEVPCRTFFEAMPEQIRRGMERLDISGNMYGHFLLLEEEGKVKTDVSLEDDCSVNGNMDLKKLLPDAIHWVPYDLLPPDLIFALLTTEDGNFWNHKGISWKAIEKSISGDLEAGKMKYGGSTITMQLAKNLFLSKEKTFERKIRQMILARWLESNFSKKGILEMYFNVVEFGKDLYGIYNASHYYFGKDPWELNTKECVYLVRLLPNPIERRGYSQAWWNKVIAKTIGSMYSKGFMSEDEYTEALAQDFILAN